MKKVLITGMSGTGKSTVILELVSHGVRAVDTDSDEWCEWQEVSVEGTPPGTPPERDWIWREERIQRLLADETADALFVSGCKSNQGKFYDQFDHVVLLSAPAEVMLDRIATRTTNPYGQGEEERSLILHLKVVEPFLRATSDLEINTAATPLDDVVEALIALTENKPSVQTNHD
jgi:shikimate kinase